MFSAELGISPYAEGMIGFFREKSRHLSKVEASVKNDMPTINLTIGHQKHRTKNRPLGRLLPKQQPTASYFIFSPTAPPIDLKRGF